MQHALEKGFYLFTFSGYSFLLSECQKSHTEAGGAGGEKGQIWREGVGLDTSQGCFSWHDRNWGGEEKWGAEGCWAVKLGGVMGLGVTSQYQPYIPYAVTGQTGLSVKVLGAAVAMD